MNFLWLLPAFIFIEFIFLIIAEFEFLELLKINLLVIILVCILSFCFYGIKRFLDSTIPAQAQTEMTARVEIQPGNCYTTYLNNQECFNNCIK
jgi:hypothetical protein